MQKNPQAVYYPRYLCLSELLDAQRLESAKYGEPAHDEMLFVITHQVYELWFKQILHELGSVLAIFDQPKVDDQQLPIAVHRLNRITRIQGLLNDQIAVMESMTPQEFLSFRDYLVPASGFQSTQFKTIEIRLGLQRQQRLPEDQAAFCQRLEPAEQQQLRELEQQPSLFTLVERWLTRMPFLQQDEFSFWQHYQQAAEQAFAQDRRIIQGNPGLDAQGRANELAELEKSEAAYQALFESQRYSELQQQGVFRLNREALLAALFIYQYREEPVFHLPFQLLTALTDIDENLTLWRYRHAIMVQRMLGSKIGTGGSSGHHYLKRTTEANRIFTDFFTMASFLLPKEVLPRLPNGVRRSMGFAV